MNAKEVKMVADSDEIASYELEALKDLVIWGDAIKVLPKLPSEVCDMVFLDPPYFLQLPKGKNLRRWKAKTVVEGVDEDWDEFAGFSDYDRFIRATLTRLKRVMKPDATLWVIGTYHNIFRVGKIMQDLDFWILNDVIWLKSNPMPNWLNVRFTNAVETLIWAVKDKSVKDYTFHSEIAKELTLGKLALSIWRLPLCAGKERLRDEEGNKIHPTQKPESLLERVIRISTDEGDWVLDPMAGVSTTGAVARRFGRHFTMIEKRRDYVDASLSRLQDVKVRLLQH